MYYIYFSTVRWPIFNIEIHFHNVFVMYGTLPYLKKCCTLALCKRPPFALITERICCGIVFDNLMQCHNIYLCGDMAQEVRAVVWQSEVCRLHSFTTRAWWILALSSWNMPKPPGKKRSIDGITWSFSPFRNSANLQCLDLTNWNNPRS